MDAAAAPGSESMVIVDYAIIYHQSGHFPAIYPPSINRSAAFGNSAVGDGNSDPFKRNPAPIENWSKSGRAMLNNAIIDDRLIGGIGIEAQTSPAMLFERFLPGEQDAVAFSAFCVKLSKNGPGIVSVVEEFGAGQDSEIISRCDLNISDYEILSGSQSSGLSPAYLRLSESGLDKKHT